MKVQPLDERRANALRELIRSSRGVGRVKVKTWGKETAWDVAEEDDSWVEVGGFEGDLLSWSEWHDIKLDDVNDREGLVVAPDKESKSGQREKEMKGKPKVTMGNGLKSRGPRKAGSWWELILEVLSSLPPGARFALVISVFSLISALANAQTPYSPGGEFQVNSYTTSLQRNPAVGPDGSGGFVVAWQGYMYDGSDNSESSVHGQRFSSNGVVEGGEFLVNTYTTGPQGLPAVGPNGSGGFVLVWSSRGSTTDPFFSVQGQRYASSGLPLGDQFQVNTYPAAFPPTSPAISLDGSGGFVVVWGSDSTKGTDTDPSSIQGQRFESDGTAIGGEFQVNSFTTDEQRFPSVALDGSGGFVVVWESDGSNGTDTDGRSILGQRFASDGLGVGDEFQINSTTVSAQSRPKVGSSESGGFSVVWESFGSSGTDTDGWSINGQRFTSNGDSLGAEFQVNTYTTSAQRNPDLWVGEEGDLIVVWDSDGSSTDQNPRSVQGQHYSSLGLEVGDEFRVNTYTTSDQFFPGIGADGRGGFVVVWTSNGSSGSDDSQTSVQGQRFHKLLFADGFESGDTQAWSSTMP